MYSEEFHQDYRLVAELKCGPAGRRTYNAGRRVIEMAKRRRILNAAAASPTMRQHRARRRSKVTAWSIGLGALALVVLAGAAVLLLGQRPAMPAELTPAEAMARYSAGALVLDVRTQAEWNQGHIANSILIPLDDLSARLGEVPRDRDIIVVCRSGARSTEGATILRQAGFTRVSCLTGGLQGWVSAGYPLEQ